MLSDHSGVKLGMNNRMKTGEPPNAWNLSNTLLNNPWVKEENLRGTKKKYLELNGDGNTINWWNAAKAVTLNAHVTKEGTSQINNLSSHFKNLKIEEHSGPMASRKNKDKSRN